MAFGILPIFAFANAGIALHGAGLDQLLHSVPVGIAAGLFLGKPIGIMLMTLLIVKLGWSKLPTGSSLMDVLGVSLLCGVGFTMSLFIGGLAFGGDHSLFDERLGIIVGSILSGIAGYLLLKKSLKPAYDETAIDLTRSS